MSWLVVWAEIECHLLMDFCGSSHWMKLIDWLGDVLHNQSICTIVRLWTWWGMGGPFVLFWGLCLPVLDLGKPPHTHRTHPWLNKGLCACVLQYRRAKLSGQGVTGSALMLSSINEWPSENGVGRKRLGGAEVEERVGNGRCVERGRKAGKNGAGDLFGWDNSDGHENASITGQLSLRLALCTAIALTTESEGGSQ